MTPPHQGKRHRGVQSGRLFGGIQGLPLIMAIWWMTPSRPSGFEQYRSKRSTRAACRSCAPCGGRRPWIACGPGAPINTVYVVADALGGPLRPEVYSDRFRRLCVAAGVRLMNLHSVRHSLAFMLHQAGVAPADCAALLGHTVEVFLST